MVVSLGDTTFKPEEIMKLVTEEVCLEMHMQEDLNEMVAPFNPKPNIEVVVEEYEEWCRPWKNTLIVHLLGKKSWTEIYVK